MSEQISNDSGQQDESISKVLVEPSVVHIARFHIGDGFDAVRIVSINGKIYFYCPEESREYIKFMDRRVSGLGELVKEKDEAVGRDS